jgi:hypothetical protein
VTFVKKEGFSSPSAMSSTGSTSSTAGGEVMGTFSPGFDSTSSSDWTMSGMDESSSWNDDGTFTEYWLVSFTPDAASGSDYYMIEPSSDELVSGDAVYYLMPTYDIVLIEDLSGDIPSDLGE